MELKHKGGNTWFAVDEDGREVKKFSGKKDDARAEFEAWLNGGDAVDEDVQDDEEPAVSGKVNLPDPDELRGAAKTAALNEMMDTTFVASEHKSSIGVQNESNAVWNVPEGWRVIWSTSRQLDGGGHANYLRSRGCRPVLADEMADDPAEDGMYCAFYEASDSGYVFMNGSQLFIGNKEKLDKLREHEYREYMSAAEEKSEETQERATELGGQPIRTTRESSPYNPMRG